MALLEAKILWTKWKVVLFCAYFLYPVDFSVGASPCKEDLSYTVDTNWQWLAPTLIRLR